MIKKSPCFAVVCLHQSGSISLQRHNATPNRQPPKRKSRRKINSFPSTLKFQSLTNKLIEQELCLPNPVKRQISKQFPYQQLHKTPPNQKPGSAALLSNLSRKSEGLKEPPMGPKQVRNSQPSLHSSWNTRPQSTNKHQRHHVSLLKAGTLAK